MFAQPLSQFPRDHAKQLRLAGNFRQAHRVLRNPTADHIHAEDDLHEYLTILLHSDEFTHPRDRLNLMFNALSSMHPKLISKQAYQLILMACAREATFVTDISPLKREYILRAAVAVWNRILTFDKVPDPRSLSLMYQISGDCNDLEMVRSLRSLSNIPSSRNEVPSASDIDPIAAFILSLGKLGRAQEAEQLYFSPSNRSIRTSPVILQALFEAYLSSNRVSKADSLISMYGSWFLTIHCCNAFVKQCASLRLYNTAMDFLTRMTHSEGTGFPLPDASTYNLLLHGLCTPPSGSDERDVSTEKALFIVDLMKKQGIEPTIVTFNNLIRSFVARGEVQEALSLCLSMKNPDSISFIYLMQGAADSCDLTVAEKVLKLLRQSQEQPKYRFFKSYLEVVARINGPADALSEARKLLAEFNHVSFLDDVGNEEAMRMALIHACGKANDLGAAFNALGDELAVTKDENRGELTPLYIATVLLQACLDCRALGQALEVFHSLRAVGLLPNFEVYESLINGLCLHVRDSVWLHAKSNDSLPSVTAAVDVVAYPKQEDDAISNDDGIQTQSDVPSGVSRMEVFDVALSLVREMHASGEARSHRKASYMYNTLIGAAAAADQWEVSEEIFRRMTRHRSIEESAEYKLGEVKYGRKRNGTERESDAVRKRKGGVLIDCENVPRASVSTYNAMIAAAWRCGRKGCIMRVFEQMQADRDMEPNASTLSLLADISLAGGLPPDSLRTILRVLDRSMLSERLARKRVQLRKKVLGIRWVE